MTTKAQQTEETPRQRMRAWLKVQVEGLAEVRLTDLTEQAAAHFAKDKVFLAAFLKEAIKPLVYEQARLVMQDTRGAMVTLGDELVSREEVQARAARLGSKWARWMEHVGDRHVNLLRMTKSDLLVAAGERRARAATEVEIAKLWETIADRLEEGQEVGEQFTPEQIEVVRLSLHQPVAGPDTANMTEKEAA